MADILNPSEVAQAAAEDALALGDAGRALSSRLPNMVKGAGFASIGGNAPIEDPDKVMTMAQRAESALRQSVKQSIANPQAVLNKAINPSFSQQFPLFMAQTPQGMGFQNLVSDLQRFFQTELGKNFTTTSPLSTGLVPFDLLAPSRLIYPVYSPLRNKFPRVGGQGTSRRAKVLTGIQGSQTGGSAGNPARISITELPGGGSLSSWPTQLPSAGTQAAVDLNVPYKFFGLTEALTWLAQFTGQGFEDISALANLVLLQEIMLGEEYQLISGTGFSLTTPTAPTTAARTAGSNETTLSGVTTNVFVRIVAKNFFGQTAAGAATTQAWSAGQVIDVTINPVPGALSYDIYTSTGASEPANGSRWLFKADVGGTKFTLQGALPTSGTNPPTSDSGTGNTTDYEGMLSTLTGWASTNGIYPSNWLGGYVNQSVAAKLKISVLEDACSFLWDNVGATGVTNAGQGGFRANPAELIVEGFDARNFSDSILAQASGQTAYELFISQSEVGNIKAGAAISQFQNPITRDMIRLLVHPWLKQGTAFVMSYNLPLSFSNVANVWENTLVQDYLSVSWPVIDASFRYSVFFYGALICYGPQYCGILQGLQKSDATPYS